MSSGCYKDSTLTHTGDSIVGFWQITKYTVGGIDSLASIKLDSACFPSFHFYYGFNDIEAVESVQGFSFPDSLFACHFIGTWGYYRTYLVMMFRFSGNEFGPLLSEQLVHWNILGQNDDELMLFVKFENQDCYLNLKRR